MRVNLADGDLSSISFNLNSDFDAATFVIEGIQANTVFDCNVDVQIEAGSSPTTFMPYINGKQYTLNFPQTIYGGEVDIDGALTVTHGEIASYNGETINEPWISSLDEYVPNTSPTIGAQVVYPLTTPTTTPINPVSIPTLEGTNNIFADCGDISLEYIKGGDFTEAVESIVEVTEKNDGSDHAYSISEQKVGRWIDGSDVYELTFDLGNLPNNTTKEYELPIGIDFLISVNGSAYSQSGDGYFRPLPFATNDSNAIRIDLNGYYANGHSQMRLITYADWSSYKGRVVLRYTKVVE